MMETIFANHQSIEMWFIAFGIFILGYIECFIFKYPKSAYVTWFFSLLCVSALIVNPPTIFRICIGAGVFICGLTLMYRFDKKRLKKGKKDTL